LFCKSLSSIFILSIQVLKNEWPYLVNSSP
jgi:hypothetical protein